MLDETEASGGKLAVSREEFFADYDTPNKISIAVANECFDILVDLKPLTIINESGRGFIISINQLETLTGGSIEVDGELIGYKHVTKNGQDMLQTLDDKEIAAQRSRLGMVFQRFNLFPHMTALENVMEAPIHVQHQSKKAARDLAVAELQRVGLGDRMDYYPSQLSGGQQQRVAIARALVNNPAVILADEATGNLDTRTSFEILVLFQKLHAMGRTIIFVTHNPEIAQYSSRNITLRDGLIREDTLNSNILSAAEALAQLPLPQDD